MARCAHVPCADRPLRCPDRAGPDGRRRLLPPSRGGRQRRRGPRVPRRRLQDRRRHVPGDHPAQGPHLAPVRCQSSSSRSPSWPTPPPSRSTAISSRARPPGTRRRSGDCDLGQDDNWDAKLAILLDDPVPLVSFTFGCPTAEVIDSFHRVGTRTAVTVTTPQEARAAEEAGADALCVQGIEAGGHQGTHRDDPRTGRRRLRPAHPPHPGPRGGAPADDRGRRHHAGRADRGRRRRRGAGRPARHRLPGLPRVRRPAACTSSPSATPCSPAPS